MNKTRPLFFKRKPDTRNRGNPSREDRAGFAALVGGCSDELPAQCYGHLEICLFDFLGTCKSTQPEKIAVLLFDTGNRQVEIFGKAMTSPKIRNWSVFFLVSKACWNLGGTLAVRPLFFFC